MAFNVDRNRKFGLPGGSVCSPGGHLQHRRKCQTETAQSGSPTCESEGRMEPVRGGQRRVERCQPGHSNPPPILEQIKARPAHILSATSNPSGVQAFALLYSERFHSTSRNTGRHKNSVTWTEMSRPSLINDSFEAPRLAPSRPGLNIICLSVYLIGHPLIRLLSFFFFRRKT